MPIHLQVEIGYNGFHMNGGEAGYEKSIYMH